MLRRRNILLATPAIWAARSRAAAANMRVTMTYGGDALQHMVLFVARDAGFFAAEDLAVDWVNVGSGTRQAASVMGGSADFTPLALLHAIKARAEGADLVAFANLFDIYAMTLVLSEVAARKAGIEPAQPLDERVRRLRGLRIGISAPGSSTDALIRSLLAARRMDSETDIQLQPFGSGASIYAAFEKRLTEGFVYTAPLPEMAVASGRGVVVINPFLGEVPELIGVPISTMISSRTALRRKEPELAAAARAFARAQRFIQEQPGETRALLGRVFAEVPAPILDRAVDTYRAGASRTPLISPDQVRRSVAWMNIGAAAPIDAKYEDVVAVEPARSAADSVLR